MVVNLDSSTYDQRSRWQLTRFIQPSLAWQRKGNIHIFTNFSNQILIKKFRPYYFLHKRPCNAYCKCVMLAFVILSDFCLFCFAFSELDKHSISNMVVFTLHPFLYQCLILWDIVCRIRYYNLNWPLDLCLKIM